MKPVLGITVSILASLPAQLAAQSTPSANAAAIYKQGWKDAVRSLEIEDGSTAWIDREIPPHEIDFDDQAFAEAVTKIDRARALFVQASQIEHCDVWDPGGLVADDRGCFAIFQLAKLVAAHGWHAQSNDPGASISDAIALLACSRHLAGIEHRDGYFHAPAIEALGMRILAHGLANLSSDARDRPHVEHAAAALESHVALHPPIDRLHDRSVAYMNRLYQPMVRMSRAARPFERELARRTRQVRARLLEIVREFHTPVQGEDLPSSEEMRTHDERFPKQVHALLDGAEAGNLTQTLFDVEAWLTFKCLELSLAWHVRCEEIYRDRFRFCRDALTRLQGR